MKNAQAGHKTARSLPDLLIYGTVRMDMGVMELFCRETAALIRVWQAEDRVGKDILTEPKNRSCTVTTMSKGMKRAEGSSGSMDRPGGAAL